MENNINYYAIIPANVRYDNRLTANAKLLYGEITALCNEKGYCWASNGYFAELYKVDKTTISRWVSQLSDFGYVTVTLKYKEGSKEVESRHLQLAVASPTPHRKIVKGATVKMRWGYTQKCGGAHRKIVKVNTTTNNTINTTKKSSGESSSPTSVSSAKKDSKLFSAEKGPNKKVQKWFDHATDIVDAYEFDKGTTEALYKFLEMLSQMNALIPDMTIRAQLTRLSQSAINEVDRCKIVDATISRGWKSLDYMLNEHFKTKTANFDTAKNSQNQFYTEEQKKQMREDYKNASEDDLF